ncbi:hypothetical protein PVAP13_7NG293824 [Panicum virgatum]|uniref:Uncharacterized protein n=1 Tax=Panicum virgatum TaxID=38727 RepID=A0A8T0Q6B4_PANVG|nr:hypothetical protein PVAP13_7NG293824 [Panicum virgatum]
MTLYCRQTQAHRPCQASSSRTWRRGQGRGVGTRPPLARRGRRSGRLTQRATGWRPKAARRRRGSATALRCAARVPAIPRRVSRRAAAAEGDTRAHGGAVEETWNTATGGSMAPVRDAGTSIDAGRGGDGERGARAGRHPGWTGNGTPTSSSSASRRKATLACTRWTRLFADRGVRHRHRERQQAAPMPGLLADLMQPHRRHRPVHPHVHAVATAQPEMMAPATAASCSARFRRAKCPYAGLRLHTYEEIITLPQPHRPCLASSSSVRSLTLAAPDRDRAAHIGSVRPSNRRRLARRTGRRSTAPPGTRLPRDGAASACRYVASGCHGAGIGRRQSGHGLARRRRGARRRWKPGIPGCG